MAVTTGGIDQYEGILDEKPIDASFLLNLHHFVSFGASGLHTGSKIASMMCKLQSAQCVYMLKHTEVS